jgi:hypothetical protein
VLLSVRFHPESNQSEMDVERVIFGMLSRYGDQEICDGLLYIHPSEHMHMLPAVDRQFFLS